MAEAKVGELIQQKQAAGDPNGSSMSKVRWCSLDSFRCELGWNTKDLHCPWLGSYLDIWIVDCDAYTALGSFHGVGFDFSGSPGDALGEPLFHYPKSHKSSFCYLNCTKWTFVTCGTPSGQHHALGTHLSYVRMVALKGLDV
jgi:hypothetical protein